MEAIKEWFVIATTNKTTLQMLADYALLIFSVGGVFLSTSPNPKIRFTGFLCGIISQPMWFIAAIKAHSLGILLNSLFFTLLWFYRARQLYKAKKDD